MNVWKGRGYEGDRQGGREGRKKRKEGRKERREGGRKEGRQAVHFLRVDFEVGCWWLTLVIPATWEAEIRRIMVQSQPGQKKKKSTRPHLNQ
jgi:hypothetical protein